MTGKQLHCPQCGNTSYQVMAKGSVLFNVRCERCYTLVSKALSSSYRNQWMGDSGDD
jgi:protein-arginine kinase activator protein McsA